MAGNLDRRGGQEDNGISRNATAPCSGARHRSAGRAAWLILLLACLTACSGRPLTEGERDFAADVVGDGLDLDQVRLSAGLGLLPLPATPEPPPKADRRTIPGVCDRVPQGPRTEPPPAFALWNRIHLAQKYYRDDTAPSWPKGVLLPQSLIMAHELIHVWQWQNRGRTGYRPGRAVLEGLLNLDPYFYAPGEGDRFFGFGFEQQAALMEDYVCYVLLDPENPRRAELRGILAPHFPVDRLDRALKRPEI